MTRRWPGLILVLTTVAAIAAAPSGLMAKTTHRCPPHAGRVMAVDAQAVLYTDSVSVFACLRPSGAARSLYDPHADFSAGSGGRLAGRFVAFLEEVSNPCDKDPTCPTAGSEPATSVNLVDLRSGHRSTADVYDAYVLRVSGRGLAAWTEPATSSNATVVQVNTLDRRGERTIAGGAIDRRSLALHGTRLTWTEAGEQHSATVKPR